MGISGLLPFLKEATESVNIRQFEGCVVAVDTYCWIYRGAFSCAEQLALGTPTDGHVKYVLKYVHKLLEWNIKPIMVFDGCCLPSKKNTELKRKEQKEMYRKKAAQCLKDGKKSEARECFQRCLNVTQKMAHEVIKAVHDLGVDVIVAPYEADAQLTYLSKTGIAQIIITEDSDLVLFGCEKILYKLDINGNGNLVYKDRIPSITQFKSADDFERFRWMCILSGCDYLENLPGIGLGKAKKLLKQTKKTQIEEIIKNMSKELKMPNLKITNEYIENFIKADKTFKYQIVFDPMKRKLIPLNDYLDDIIDNESLSYAGNLYDHETALQLALGNLDVNNKSVVDNFDPENWTYKIVDKYSKNTPSHLKSIWSSDFFVNKTKMFEKHLNNENISPKRANTKGMEKIIETNSLKSNDLKRKLNQSPIENSTKELTPKNKKNKIELMKNDIDNLINEYATNTPKLINDSQCKNQEKLDDSSTYFSSASKHMSPVLTKLKKKSQIFSAEKTHSTYFSFNSDVAESVYKSPLIINKTELDNNNELLKNSPIDEIKSTDCITRESIFTSTECYQTLTNTTENTQLDCFARKNISIFFDKSAETKENIENEIQLSDFKKSTNNNISNGKSLKQKSKSKPAPFSTNTRPISDFFSKFENKKSGVNKFTL